MATHSEREKEHDTFDSAPEHSAQCHRHTKRQLCTQNDSASGLLSNRTE